MRRATTADIPAAGLMLARAFHDDPAYSSLFRDERVRPEIMQFLEERFLAMRMETGPCHVVERDGRLAGCVMWMGPGVHHGLLTYIRHGLVKMPVRWGFRLVARMLRVDARIERIRVAYEPKEPYWYLAQLGVDPDFQGQGIGSSLLRAGLHDHVQDKPATLFTSKASNVPFYERNGFEIVHDEVIDDYTLWFMTRPKPPRP